MHFYHAINYTIMCIKKYKKFNKINIEEKKILKLFLLNILAICCVSTQKKHFLKFFVI